MPGSYNIQLEKDKNYAWCSCGLSSKLPFCNGAHNSTDKRPIVFKTEKTEMKSICGCQKSANAPFCDGSHLN